MAFLNDLSRGLKITGQTVAQKTKEIGETVQIKSQINTEKETIARLYAAIGKQVFESGNEDEEKKFFTEFASIRKAMDKIAVLEASLTGMDGCIFCTECGARIDKNSKFCMKCGSVIDANKVKLGAAVAEAMRGTANEELEAEHQMVAHQSVGAEQTIDYASNRYI